MTIKPSDRLGYWLFEAGRQWGCELSPRVATCLMEDIEQGLGGDTLEQRMEFALDLEEVFDESERHAYKMALGHLMDERAQAKREALSIPFAPR